MENDLINNHEQLSLFSKEVEFYEQHILTKTEPREEGGVTSEFKVGYQKELATLACVLMLFPDEHIRSVSVELHEDYVIEYEDNHLEFRQVKHKDEGESATFGTLAGALHNLFLQYITFPQIQNLFTLECNQKAHSTSKGNLFELKTILIKKRKTGLDPADEDRFLLLKHAISELSAFSGENFINVDNFIERLNIRTNQEDVNAIKEIIKSKLILFFTQRFRTTSVDIKMVNSIYDCIYLLVDKAGRERDDRSKRIIYKKMVEEIIPIAPNLAELTDPITADYEYHLLTDIDPGHTVLEHKCNEAELKDVVDILIDAKIEARNRNDHYRVNTPALNYINRLRKTIYRADKDEKFRSKTDGQNHNHSLLYLRMMEKLNSLARDEKNNDVGVRVDFEYLRGLYAQLVSECPITP